MGPVLMGCFAFFVFFFFRILRWECEWKNKLMWITIKNDGKDLVLVVEAHGSHSQRQEDTL